MNKKELISKLRKPEGREELATLMFSLSSCAGENNIRDAIHMIAPSLIMLLENEVE